MTAPAPRRGGARAFTLVELVVYLALVTGGLAVLLGLELAASRAWFLEHALVELAFRGDDLGTHFRDDVRQGTVVSLPPLPAPVPGPRARATVLVVSLPGGQEVRYDLEDCTSIEPVSTPERHAAGLRSTGGKLVRTLLPRPGAEAKDRTAWTGLEKLTLERILVGAREGFELEAGFAVTRGTEVTARRRFRFFASAIAEGAP